MQTCTWSGLVLAICLLTPSAFGNTGEEAAGWHNDCSTLKGWYCSTENPTFEAKVEQVEPSVIKVTQEGKDGWGKAAVVVKDVNLDNTSRLEVKVSRVDKDSAYQVGVASLDWTQFFVVVPRSSADGIKVGDIKAATGWTGVKDFNVVVIVEGKGKGSYFDELKIVGGK